MDGANATTRGEDDGVERVYLDLHLHGREYECRAERASRESGVVCNRAVFGPKFETAADFAAPSQTIIWRDVSPKAIRLSDIYVEECGATTEFPR